MYESLLFSLNFSISIDFYFFSIFFFGSNSKTTFLFTRQVIFTIVMLFSSA